MKTSRQTGYVDAHLHITAARSLDAVAAAGVAAVRDAGSVSGSGLPGKTGERGPLLIVSAGRALFPRGGYGALFGRPVETRDDIRREIQELAKAGAGIIKVMASGMVSLTDPGRITAGGFPAGDLAFLAAEARTRGLGVMAHANGADAIGAAVAAGVRSVEHGFFMTEALLRLMAEQGVYWVPTAGALERAAERAGRPGAVRDLLRAHRAMIGRAYEIGVPLAVGTDCVLPDERYGEHYQRELELFEQAGIPREAVERIAREAGWELLGPRQDSDGRTGRG